VSIIIKGNHVCLVPATNEDKRWIYDAGTNPDIARMMMGLPYFPDHPAPTWKEFCQYYPDFYFDGSAPEKGMSYIIYANDNIADGANCTGAASCTNGVSNTDNPGYSVDASCINYVSNTSDISYTVDTSHLRPAGDTYDNARTIRVGAIFYTCFYLKKHKAELDIWMNDIKNCGMGYGPDALRTLCRHLYDTQGISEFIIRPSARNQRAVKAYRKAGFKICCKGHSLAKRIFMWRNYLPEYRVENYKDEVVMALKFHG